MLKLFRKIWPKKEKRIAFIDGDQDLQQLMNAYNKHIVGTDTQTHFIRAGAYVKEPKLLKNLPEINKIYLQGFRRGKEITDKYIGAFIQKAISDGYNHITVISSDYDFIDIFKMAIILDKRSEELTFRMIVPNAIGRLADLPTQVANIEIVKNR